MTTMTFTSITGSSISLADTEVITSKIQGVESTPDRNIYDAKITARDGKKVIASDYATRPITLDGTIFCATPTTLRTKLETLQGIVAGKGYLDIGLEGGTTRRYTVEVKNWIITSAPYNLSWVPFSINLEAIEDPFGRDIASTSMYSATAINTDVAQTSNLLGSAEPAVNAKVVIPTVGGLTGIEFRNETTNSGLLLQPTFGVSDTLVVDTANKSCQLNGLPVDFAGQVPTFAPGNNNWRLNFLSSSITIDTQQTLYTTEKFIYGTTFMAQSFQASGAIKCHRVDLMLARLGNPSNVKIDIYTDTAGHPNAAISGATATIVGSNITTTPGYTSFYLQNVTSLSASTTYWIVARVTGAINDVNNGFYLKASGLNPYATYGLSRTPDSGTNWSVIASTDAVFRVWKTAVLASNTDINEESYTEDFTATTNKDAGNTTANWDTVNTKLIMGTTSSTDTGFLSPSAHPGNFSTYDNWTNAANAYAADASFATMITPATPDSSTNDQTYKNFGFGIASSTLVSGFDIKVKGNVDSGTGTLKVFLIFDSNDDGALNIFDLSQSIARGSVDFTLTSTNTEYTLSYPGGSWLGRNIADGLFTIWIQPATGSKTYSLDLVQVKAYSTTYDITKKVGQSSALNASNTPILASVRMAANQVLSGKTITYAVQGDTTLGFQTVTNNVSANLPISALGATPSHKWKATLNGTVAVSPIIDDLVLNYKGAMPVGATTDRLAQSFSSGVGGSVSAVLLNIVKTASDTINYTVEIHPDSAGSPSGTPITNGTATILAANVPNQTTGDFSWISTAFATPPSLSASTTYWIVIKIGTAGSSKLLWRARGGDSYASGAAKYSVNSGSAYTTMTNQDFLFQILSSGSTFSANVDITYQARN